MRRDADLGHGGILRSVAESKEQALSWNSTAWEATSARNHPAFDEASDAALAHHSVLVVPVKPHPESRRAPIAVLQLVGEPGRSFGPEVKDLLLGAMHTLGTWNSLFSLTLPILFLLDGANTPFLHMRQPSFSAAHVPTRPLPLTYPHPPPHPHSNTPRARSKNRHGS